MRTILAPTDFSTVSNCAVEYAAEFAKHASAKLILFHAYQIHVASPDGIVAVPLEEIQEESIKRLKSLAEKLRKKFGKFIKVEYKNTCGFPVEEINRIATSSNADLIVMGMQGGGYISEKIIGSITTALIKKSNCPVLAIHQGTKFTPLKKIAFACDYQHLNYSVVLKPLNEIANHFHSEILIVNVVQELEEVSSVEKAVEGIKLNRALNEMKHSFHYAINNDIADGITDFIKEHGIDLVAMVPHSHTVFETLFKKSNTKHMAFQIAKPFLAIPDAQ